MPFLEELPSFVVMLKVPTSSELVASLEEELEAELLEESSEEDGVTLLEELGSEDGVELLIGTLEEGSEEDGVLVTLLEEELGSLVWGLVWEFELLGADASFEEEGAASLVKEACSLESETSLLLSNVDSSLAGMLEKGMRSGVMLLQEASNATADKVSRIKGVFFINKASFF